jgi:hypothetical protein
MHKTPVTDPYSGELTERGLRELTAKEMALVGGGVLGRPLPIAQGDFWATLMAGAAGVTVRR